jgi:hypothetical protein
MAENKQVYEAERMSFPPLRLVLGEVSLPDPAGLRKANKEWTKLHPEMQGNVKRLIAHLKGEK